MFLKAENSEAFKSIRNQLAKKTAIPQTVKYQDQSTSTELDREKVKYFSKTKQNYHHGDENHNHS